MRRAMMLAALAGLIASPALADGPESPPAPWFVIANTPSHDPAFVTARWLWSREDNALRYCRLPKDKDAWTCSDLTLPSGRWVLQRIQEQPEAGTASSARFYSPDKGATLNCAASDEGAFSCN